MAAPADLPPWARASPLTLKERPAEDQAWRTNQLGLPSLSWLCETIQRCFRGEREGVSAREWYLSEEKLVKKRSMWETWKEEEKLAKRSMWEPWEEEVLKSSPHLGQAGLEMEGAANVRARCVLSRTRTSSAA